jgi:hypothetical protein
MTIKVISADSHIMEPPGLWAERPFRDRAPQVIPEWNGKHGEFLIGWIAYFLRRLDRAYELQRHVHLVWPCVYDG